MDQEMAEEAEATVMNCVVCGAELDVSQASEMHLVYEVNKIADAYDIISLWRSGLNTAKLPRSTDGKQ
jgi:hypothetical protein